LSELPEKDRDPLSRVFDQLSKHLEVASPPATHVAIHGSPHPYNVLLVDGQPHFIDFEPTCVGPVEWDLAHTSSDTVRNYARRVNAEILDACRGLVSVKTAAWCWADVNRGDLRFHAEMHLAHVKEVFGA